MSKEIAQTVGGKRIAWLLAIVAAFAVFATVQSQFRSDDARASPVDLSVADTSAVSADICEDVGELVFSESSVSEINEAFLARITGIITDANVVEPKVSVSSAGANLRSGPADASLGLLDANGGLPLLGVLVSKTSVGGVTAPFWGLTYATSSVIPSHVTHFEDASADFQQMTRAVITAGERTTGSYLGAILNGQSQAHLASSISTYFPGGDYAASAVMRPQQVDSFQGERFNWT